jgi:hypothetical protein
MKLNVLRFSLVLSFTVIGATLVMADEADKAKPVAEGVAEKKASIPDLVKKLDSDDFLTRQVASQKLAELGADAFPELEKATQNGSLETISQVMIILNNHYQSKDEKLSQLAKESLEKIAEGNNATSSQRAKEILKPVEKPNDPQDPFGNPLGRGGVGPRRFQIQIPNFGQPGNVPNFQPGMNGFQKQVSTVNGEKRIRVSTNGQEIDISEGANGIIMKITENGKTDEFKADNAADLKKKFPQAFKLYEEHAGDNIVVNGANIQAGNIFGGAAPRMNIGADVDQRITEVQLKQIEMQLQSIEQRLGQLTRRSDKNAKELKETIEKLQTLRSALSTAVEALRKDQEAVGEPIAPRANQRAKDENKPQAKNSEVEKPAREIILEDEKK